MKKGETKAYVISQRMVHSLTNGIYLKRKELRETEKYLIDDATGTKYKKETEVSPEGLVATCTDRDKWHSTTTTVYLLDSKFVQESVKHNKRVRFQETVKRVLRDLTPTTFEEATEVVSKHNLLGLTGDIPE